MDPVTTLWATRDTALDAPDHARARAALDAVIRDAAPVRRRRRLRNPRFAIGLGIGGLGLAAATTAVVIALVAQTAPPVLPATAPTAADVLDQAAEALATTDAALTPGPGQYLHRSSTYTEIDFYDPTALMPFGGGVARADAVGAAIRTWTNDAYASSPDAYPQTLVEERDMSWQIDYVGDPSVATEYRAGLDLSDTASRRAVAGYEVNGPLSLLGFQGPLQIFTESELPTDPAAMLVWWDDHAAAAARTRAEENAEVAGTNPDPTVEAAGAWAIVESFTSSAMVVTTNTGFRQTLLRALALSPDVRLASVDGDTTTFHITSGDDLMEFTVDTTRGTIDRVDVYRDRAVAMDPTSIASGTPDLRTVTKLEVVDTRPDVPAEAWSSPE